VFYYSSDPGIFMSFPLIVLSFFSLFFGEMFQDLFLSYDFWKNFLVVSKEQHTFLFEDFLYPIQKNYVLLFTLSGIFLAVFSSIVFSSSFFYKIRKFLIPFYKKLYFDPFYYKAIVKNILKWAYKGPYQNIDKGLLEYFGYTGLLKPAKWIIEKVRYLQTGDIFHYLVFVIFGVIFILLLIF